MTRQHQSLQELKTNVNNQLHADQQGMYQNELVISQLMLLIKTIEGQIKDTEAAIAAHLNKDSEVAKLVDGITLIKGVGALTVAIIPAETNGFALFKNIPQLISFAGYDVVENQSGNHIGKTRISKKGNGHTSFLTYARWGCSTLSTITFYTIVRSNITKARNKNEKLCGSTEKTARINLCNVEEKRSISINRKN